MKRLAIAAIAAAGLVLLIWFAWSQWQSARVATASADLSADQAGAVSASGQDAIATTGAAYGREAAISDLGRGNVDAIRSAPGAGAPVDPALHDLAIAGLCRHAINQRDPECVRRSPPERVD